MIITTTSLATSLLLLVWMVPEFLGSVAAAYSRSDEIITQSSKELPSLGLWSFPNENDEGAFIANQQHYLHDEHFEPMIGVERNYQPPQVRQTMSSTGFQVGIGFQGLSYFDNLNFNDNQTLVPPDPICAAGQATLVAIVNAVLEIRNKQGGLIFKQGFADFFASLGPIGLLYDPKVVYDQYEDRFVMVVLDQLAPGGLGPVTDDNGDRTRHLQSTNTTGNSTILLAVSKSGSPTSNNDWYFQAINSLEIDNAGSSYWADYPGLEVSPEAVYITTNVFPFSQGGQAGNRLWILSKSSFYSGGPLSYTKHDPTYGEYILTMMPALVYGGQIGNNIGTYLVAYDGFATSDGTSYIYVVTVLNPLTSPTFSGTFVELGVIDNLRFSIPTAPQLGGNEHIATGDRRALDAAWRNNSLWMTTEVLPLSGPNANQATSYWIQINTNTFTVQNQGQIGGEDIAIGTFTAYASVAVNSHGVAAFGFAAYGPSIYAGAYVVGRNPTDPSGTVSSSFAVHQGVDYYYRVNAGTNNRWGDFSGIAVDPVDDSFWVFNEYADERGYEFDGQDGVWNTAWLRFLSTSSTPQTPAPTNQPTPAPTLRPTSKPTTAAPPTNKPPTVVINIRPGTCFSGANSVIVEGKGLVEMNNLQIGDKVKDASGNMVRVYSFGHYQQSSSTKYLQIYVKGLSRPLEVSNDHMIFVNGTAVPAASLELGGKVDVVEPFKHEAQVQKIHLVVRDGVYAPFTTSGTIMVSGVAVSSYVTLQENSSMLILGPWQSPLSIHWLCHIFQTPHRLVCFVMGTDHCRKVETYTADGISNWAEMPYFLFRWVQQNGMITTVVMVPVVVMGLVCVVCYALEHGWMYLVVLLLSAYFVTHRKPLKQLA